MRRALVLAPQVLVAVIAGIAIGLLWLTRGDDVGSGPPPSEAVTATGSVTPDTHAFGEPIVARVDVVVDNTVVDPSSVRAQPQFDPYEVVGPESVERLNDGATSRIRLSYPLRCLGEGCDPTGLSSTVELPLGRVLYRFRGRSGDAIEVLDWPTVRVTGRVSDSAVTDIRWRASETALAAPTYRVDPLKAAGGLFAAALLLAGLAAWLAWRLWRPQPEVSAADDVAVVVRSPLERAFDTACAASRNGSSGERRRALERVSRELSAIGEQQLAGEASILAWSSRGSTSEDVEDLARRSAVVVDEEGPR